MKRLTILILVAVMLAAASCKKVAMEETINTEVEKYIELLKTNEYKAFELPEFKMEDIPALIEYRNEKQVLTCFPVNAISSFGQSECRLGMYVLWTIESIRAVAIESEFVTNRFPSLNPIMQERDGDFNIEQSPEIHSLIAQAYFDWWEGNKNKDFDDFKDIDPLLETAYRWH